MSLATHKTTPQMQDMSIDLLVDGESYHIKKWSIDKDILDIDTDLRLSKDVIKKLTIVFLLNGTKYYLKTSVMFNHYRESVYSFDYIRLSDEKKDILEAFAKFLIYKKGDKMKDLLTHQKDFKVSSEMSEPKTLNSKTQAIKKHSNMFFNYFNFFLGIVFLKFN